MEQYVIEHGEDRAAASKEEQRFLEAIQDPEIRAKIISILAGP